jgi:hypothetical protein
MQQEFVDQHHRQQARPGKTSRDRMRGRRRLGERGRFLWPSLADGVVTISVAQLSYLLSGIDWRMPQATWRSLLNRRSLTRGCPTRDKPHILSRARPVYRPLGLRYSLRFSRRLARCLMVGVESDRPFPDMPADSLND